MSAKSLFYSEDHKFNQAEEKAFAREELIYNVTEDLLVAMEKKDVTKAELARKLGKGRAFVSQILSGKRNMTLATLSDICFVLGIEPQVKIHQESTVASPRQWQNHEHVKVVATEPSNVICMNNWKKNYTNSDASIPRAIGQ